jgi:hypothetical protein
MHGRRAVDVSSDRDDAVRSPADLDEALRTAIKELSVDAYLLFVNRLKQYHGQADISGYGDHLGRPGNVLLAFGLP